MQLEELGEVAVVGNDGHYCVNVLVFGDEPQEIERGHADAGNRLKRVCNVSVRCLSQVQ